jgi:hypothetical protein
VSRAYAEGTTVSAEQSRGDIERTLRRHGASSFMYATHEQTGIVGFVLHGRQIRFALPLPDVEDERFRLTPERRTRRSREAQMKAWEAECRRSWRALALVIKAKLAAVEDGIVEFEREFLAHMVVPGSGGMTFYEAVAPQLDRALEGGQVHDLIPRAITGARS